MKYLIYAAIAVCSSFVWAADQSAPSSGGSLAERMRAARIKHAKAGGGYVVKDYKAKIVAVRNLQSIFSKDELESALGKLRQAQSLPIFLVGEQEQRKDIGVEIVLVDELSAGGVQNVLTAPEEGWAKMAVRRLIADAPTAEKRERRIRLELLRTAAMAMGVGISMYQPCVMVKVRKNADIDSIQLEKMGPEGENNLESAMKDFGIEKVMVGSYRRACREGWAPKPANDEQQKIWDEYHSVPSRPIIIKPESQIEKK